MERREITVPKASRRLIGWAAAGVVVAGALLVPAVAVATPQGDGEHKVTICHRTNSVTNPYVIITVDFSGADGGLVHDNGNGDHTSHLGPVFDFQNPPPPPHNEDQWGDIIPPYSWPGDKNHPGGSYPGLNWSTAGQAIYANGCGGIVTTTVTSTKTVTSTVTTTLPAVTSTVTTTVTSPVTTTVTSTVQSNHTVTETQTVTVTQSTNSSS